MIKHTIKRTKRCTYRYALMVGLLSLVTPPLAASEISDTNKYAWSENVGWLNFKSAHAPATVHLDHLEGYVWSENAGWIRLGTFTGGGLHTYANNSAATYGVNKDALGRLSGYGWGENIGWVNFNPAHSRVTIDPVTGDFDGYAWSENVGWIHFQNSSPAYKVQRMLFGLPDEPGTGGGDVQSIPTLSWWGMLVLAGLLAWRGGRLASSSRRGLG